MAAENAPRFSAWFANDGGPLLVLPRELLGNWEGVEPPSGGRVIEVAPDWLGEEFAGTDYARACTVESVDPDGVFGVLEVGAGIGVVVGVEEQAQGVYWLQFPGRPGALLTVPLYAEEDADSLLAEAAAQLPETAWHPVRPAFRTQSGDLVLLHAADSGRTAQDYEGNEHAAMGQSIACRIAPGVYAVEACSVEVPTEPDPSRFVLCRFRPAG